MNTVAPVIGIVADRKAVTAGAWVDVENDAIPHTYVDAVVRAGGVPILVPALPQSREDLNRLVDFIDGLFLPGGRDLDASLYGEIPHAENDVPLRVRDELERDLLTRCWEVGVPVLGVCRGMQVMNVAFGGTLEQHLGDRLDMRSHRDVVGEFTAHEVRIVEGTLLAGVLRVESLETPSHHHQGLGELGNGLVVSASTSDGVVEAIERCDRAFCLGVQWHPEQSESVESERLFGYFVSEARGSSTLMR